MKPFAAGGGPGADAGATDGGREPLAWLPAFDGARWIGGAGVPEPDATGCIGAAAAAAAAGAGAGVEAAGVRG